MTDTTKLIEELRSSVIGSAEVRDPISDLLGRAADALEAAEARVVELTEALERERESALLGVESPRKRVVAESRAIFNACERILGGGDHR